MKKDARDRLTNLTLKRPDNPMTIQSMLLAFFLSLPNQAVPDIEPLTLKIMTADGVTMQDLKINRIDFINQEVILITELGLSGITGAAQPLQAPGIPIPDASLETR